MMRPSFFHHTLLATSFALCLATTGRAAEPTAAPSTARATPEASDGNAAVRALYRKGAAHYREGRPLEAREVLLSAWAGLRSYDVAAALGQVELELELYRDAAEHLDFAVRNFAPIESEETLEHVKEGLAAARAHVAVLTATGAPDGTTVLVDGVPAGTTPLAAPLFLEPGGHVVSARSGELGTRLEIYVEPGTERALTLTLSPTAPEEKATRVATSPAPSGERSVIPLVVGGAVFVAGLGVGVGFRMAASSARDDAQVLRDVVGPGGCVGSVSASCTALRDAAAREDRSANLSTAGFITAGVAAIAAPVYWLLSSEGTPERAPSASRRVRVSGWVNPGSATVRLSGSF